MGQLIASGTDERVILFVKLLEGESLTEELVKRIKHEIRSRRSPRHVPAQVGLPRSFLAILIGCLSIRLLPAVRIAGPFVHSAQTLILGRIEELFAFT